VSLARRRKSLREGGGPLAECLRAASSRPWPEPEGKYYSYRTLESWWYHHAKSGYAGLFGKAVRGDAGKSRTLDEESAQWILETIAKSPNTPLSVLCRYWQDQGRKLPSLSSVYRFLKL
jgi:hypothetical protein